LDRIAAVVEDLLGILDTVSVSLDEIEDEIEDDTPFGLEEGDEDFDDFDDSMDGDFDSAMASAGFGTDEDYGYYGGNEDE
jgi:hypothetical protein